MLHNGSVRRVLLSTVALISVLPACNLPAPPTENVPRNDSPALLMDAGHFRRAEAILVPLAEANPDDPNTAWLLSRAKAALGDLDTSLKLAEKAVAADDTNADYHVQLAATCGRIAEKANLLKQLTLAKRAKKELDTALALDPQNLDALYGLMLYYYAAPSMIGGDKKKAQQMADAMTTVDAGRGYLAQARLAHEMKDPVKEEEFYKKSIEANPQFYEPKAALAGFYLNLPKPDQASAENYACDALAADPGRADAWKSLAEIRVASQCWTELDNLLALAEQFDPDDLAPYYSAATAMLRISSSGIAGRRKRT